MRDIYLLVTIGALLSCGVDGENHTGGPYSDCQGLICKVEAEFSAECLQEFFSFCEAMELVPDEELEASSRSSGAPADRRALKVDLALFL
ncbi:predicted protein [Arabidopsis lyrata subsp. lyrata]|uniref:Predicted protein n=1 Tax=Arabidopsis lyrata subsp. lyrata TaxID=81972 RepID=D7MSC4_ARALL|nr:predicted protein [Arabidopsis lyrata subsp. lyrata]